MRETEGDSIEITVGVEGQRTRVVALGQTRAGASSERLEEEIRRPRSLVDRRQKGQGKGRI